MSAANSLAGHAILVTRPAHQAGPLARGILGRGGEPVLFPTLEIRDAPDPRPLQEALAGLASIDLAVFASANAAARALPAIAGAGGLRAVTRVAAVGEGTAAELRRRGATGVVTPVAGADSEALLATTALRDVAGRRVVIFSGVGGRDLLAATLRERGASVTVVPCYLRTCPATPTGPVRARLAAGTLSAITATSAEGIHNLYAMLDGDGEALAKLLHVTPHERVAEAARRHGVARVAVSGSGDEAMVETLATLLAHARQAASQTP
jgi:uroporphyrinogen-III synthase